MKKIKGQFLTEILIILNIKKSNLYKRGFLTNKFAIIVN